MTGGTTDEGQRGLPTSGHHLFVPPWGTDSDLLVEGPTGHHVADVLRVTPGELLSLADDTGEVAQAVCTDVSRGSARVEIQQTWTVPATTPGLTVVQGMPKGRKLEEVVQRLTEAGVDRIVAVHTARSVKQVKGPKADKLAQRWAAVALSAAQQSRRARLPRIDLIDTWPLAGAIGAVLDVRATQPLSAVLSDLLVDGPQLAELTLAIGPEGGLEGREIAESGLRPAALGDTVLRTETAGLVALSVAQVVLGRV